MSSQAAPVRILLVVFDALRPDMATPELMPNLHRFRQFGTTLSNARAIFPTDTRANVASLMTGVHPGRHGIMGNAWFDPRLHTSDPFSTISAAEVERADSVLGGTLFQVPSLGDLLARQGRSMAVISTASSGTTRLIHHTVRQHSFHMCLHCHDAEACSPPRFAEEAMHRFGPLPPADRPDLPAVTYAVDVFLRWVWTEHRPDVTVLWLNEPDTSYHWFGIGSDQALGAIRHCDEQVGRLLEWWLTDGRTQGVQLIALSDHGQIGVGGRVDLTAALTDVGLSPAGSFSQGADLLVVPGYPIRLYARGRDRALVDRAAAALLAQPWCGDLFALASVEGTLPLSAYGAAHERAPDLIVTMRGEHAPDPTGRPGVSQSDAASPFAGIHGGLSDQETACVVVLAGSCFRENAVIGTRSSAVDVLPTLLEALGLQSPPGLDGRAISEAFVQLGWAR